jgi:hypothetical protein
VGSVNILFFIFQSDWDGDIIPQSSTSSPIFLVCWNLKCEDNAESAIEGSRKRLRNLAIWVNLLDPENVKTFMVSKNCGNSFKESLVEAYVLSAKYTG